MSTVNYRTHCAWCHAELNGTYVVFLPAFDYQMEDYREMTEEELAIRYCTSECVGKRRDELIHRRKLLHEKWERWTAEIPPEVGAMLEVAMKRELGVNLSAFSRANLVKSALREWLSNHGALPAPATDVTLEEMPVELEAGR